MKKILVGLFLLFFFNSAMADVVLVPELNGHFVSYIANFKSMKACLNAKQNLHTWKTFGELHCIDTTTGDVK